MWLPFLAQVNPAAPGGLGGNSWLKVIQKTLHTLLDSNHLVGWVDRGLVGFQFLGFAIATIFLCWRFIQAKDNPDQMVRTLLTLVLTLFVIGQPRFVLGFSYKVVQGLTPKAFRADLGPDGTVFQPPPVMQDMIVEIKTSINPKGFNGGTVPTTTPADDHSTLRKLPGFGPALADFLKGLQNFDPKFWLAVSVSAIVQFFADLALFILGVLYLVISLILEVNLLVFPMMVAFWHVQLFASSSREFLKHCFAVLWWPLGWGIGVLSAQGIMGGVANVEVSISGIIAFALSIFLACFWLLFASVAGPIFIHKLITQGASIGQGLIVGGLAGGGTAAVGAGGLGAGLLLKGGGAVLGGGLSKLGSFVGGGGGGGGGQGQSSGSGMGGALAGAAGGAAGSLLGSAAGGPVGGIVGGLLGGSLAKRAAGGSRAGRSGSGGGGSGSGGSASGSGGGQEGGGEGNAEGGQGEVAGGGGGGIVGRVRSAVGRSLQSGGAGVASAGQTMGGMVNNLAARAALKIDQVGDAYSEVGGAPVSSFKANNHQLRRRAQEPILPFPKPLNRNSGGGGGGGGAGGGGGRGQANRGGQGGTASSRSRPAPPAPPGDTIDADWEVV